MGRYHWMARLLFMPFFRQAVLTSALWIAECVVSILKCWHVYIFQILIYVLRDAALDFLDIKFEIPELEND